MRPSPQPGDDEAVSPTRQASPTRKRPPRVARLPWDEPAAPRSHDSAALSRSPPSQRVAVGAPASPVPAASLSRARSHEANSTGLAATPPPAGLAGSEPRRRSRSPAFLDADPYLVKEARVIQPKASYDEYGAADGAAADASPERAQCSCCLRSFAPDRLAKHEAICKNHANTQGLFRGSTNSSGHAGSNSATLNSSGSGRTGTGPRRTRSRQHLSSGAVSAGAASSASGAGSNTHDADSSGGAGAPARADEAATAPRGRRVVSGSSADGRAWENAGDTEPGAKRSSKIPPPTQRRPLAAGATSKPPRRVNARPEPSGDAAGGPSRASGDDTTGSSAGRATSEDASASSDGAADADADAARTAGARANRRSTPAQRANASDRRAVEGTTQPASKYGASVRPKKRPVPGASSKRRPPGAPE